MTVENEAPATETPPALSPLTAVAFGAACVAAVLLLTLSRFDMGMALAAGIGSLVVAVAAGSEASRKGLGGVAYARAGSVIAVIVIVGALVRMS